MPSIPVTITGVLTYSGGDIPSPPLGFWGGGNVPMPTPPIANVPGAPGYRPPSGPVDPGFSAPPGWGAHPAHPIVLPPNKPGEPPLVIWGGGNEPFPTPPIELPGLPPPPTDGGPPVNIVKWHTAWTPQTGWMVIGVPNVPHPVPSR